MPARPPSHGPGDATLPQRPGDYAPRGSDIDNLIRSAAQEGDTAKAGKKDKDKKGRMFYDDADTSPEERMAALPRYAFTAA